MLTLLVRIVVLGSCPVLMVQFTKVTALSGDNQNCFCSNPLGDGAYI
jgi:hypothetical protein